MSDIDKIKRLRQSTGAGFKDCSSALKEASGDLEKAIEILRIKGVSTASKTMSREANEGLIFIHGDEKKTSIIEINCETLGMGGLDVAFATPSKPSTSSYQVHIGTYRNETDAYRAHHLLE